MNVSRRRLVLATLAAVGASTAGGCARPVNRHTAPVGLDEQRLAGGFAKLARQAKPGVFDLGLMVLGNDAVWYADGAWRFPMQGVVNAPLAAAALAEVDAGRLKLNETIRITPLDLSPPPSHINRIFPPGGDHLDLPAIDLIALAAQEGDNTAADVVMRRVGGPGAVTAWLRAHGINNMRVDRYQREIQPAVSGLEPFRPAWSAQAAWLAARQSIPPRLREAAMAAYLADPRDTTTAQAAVNFLGQLAHGALLSPASTALLLRLMSATRSPARLRAGLPAGAGLAHAWGSSVTELGLTPVTNDIGIVTLADGRRFAVAALLAGSTGAQSQRDGLIAQAARLVVSALI